MYHAFDQEGLLRRVALKVPSNDILFNNQFQKRFRTEAQILGRMRHPNIVTFYHAQFDASPRFLVAEFVKGRDLEKAFNQARKAGGWIDRPYALWIVEKLALALHHAHRKGVIHRDVKPANILINGEIVKLTDFGLARSGDPEHDLHTRPAPRLARRSICLPSRLPAIQPGSAPRLTSMHSGLFSTSFSAATGLFEGKDRRGRLSQDPQRHRPALRRAGSLDSEGRPSAEVCLKALARDPAERWPDYAAFAAALRPWTPEDILDIRRDTFGHHQRA